MQCLPGSGLKGTFTHSVSLNLKITGFFFFSGDRHSLQYFLLKF